MPQTSPSTVEAFITWGNETLRQKNWDEAVNCWALMREKFPEHPRGYIGGAKALKESGAFKAADTLILEGMKKFPEETGLYVEYGDIAVRQKDWLEAAKRWALMREKFPEHPRGYVGGVTALKGIKDFKAADAFILEGIKKFPKETVLYVEYGDIAMRQRNWPEAIKRWALMREKIPDKGYLGGARALKENKEFEAADALVVKGLKNTPKDPRLYIEYGDIAMRQKNWPEAIKRWALMREKCPEHPNGYTGGSKALKEQGDFKAADILILAGLKKFPKEVDLYAEYGDIAMRQRNWSEAIKRWALMREKCPEHPRGYVLGEVALKEMGQFEDADALVTEFQENLSKGLTLPTRLQQERIIARKYRTWNLIRDAKIYRNFGVETYFFFAPLVDEIKVPSEWESLLIQKHDTQSIIRTNVDKYYEASGINDCFPSKEEFLEHIKHPLRNTIYKNYKKNVYMKSKYLNIDIDGCRVLNNHPANPERTIHIFGDSVGMIWIVKDNDMFSYHLQELLNNNGYNIKVENHCVAGVKIDTISNYINDTKININDIIIIFFNHQKSKQLLSHIDFENFFSLSFQKYFDRPHNYGELFIDRIHPNQNMYKIIAKEMFESIKPALNKPLQKYQDNVAETQHVQLNDWLKALKCERKYIGSIVINCNPFTNGHRYLIEYAAKESVWLYIFVVEEDKSIFPFKDRFELVKQGTSDLKNVTILPSGQFIISQLTFPEYSEKESIQDIEIDPSLDVELFAKHIAPSLGINVRFAGSEPLDKITYQYNECMKQILPKYGIEFREIPRKELNGNVISASMVRKLLYVNNFDDIEMMVPKTTFNYLKSFKQKK